MDEVVSLQLRMSEALVLFEWLASNNEADSLRGDPAEMRVLWDLDSHLESKLVVPFDADYDEQLARARAHVLRET